MAPLLLFFYAIALAIILGCGWLAYRLLRRRSRVLALLAGLLTAGGLVLVWPLPIHGGFMLLGEALLRDLMHAGARHAEDRAAADRQAWFEQQVGHFAFELPLLERQTLAPGWQRVTTAEHRTAILDIAHGRLWSDWQALPAAAGLPPLELARSRCAELAPAGGWALATEEEFLLMWQAGGTQFLPTAATGSMSYSADPELGITLPSYQLHGGSNAPGTARRASRFAVRCIARAPGGPAARTRRSEIPLAQWNRYQLERIAH
jgi:hypothetical protein